MYPEIADFDLLRHLLAHLSGADVNHQNLAGQTVLHYCFSYGFDELGEYFISKGIVYSDMLSCTISA
jgi:ankyrin repeat protein